MSYLIIALLVFFISLFVGAKNKSKWDLYRDRYQFIFVCAAISIFWMFSIPGLMIWGFVYLMATLIKRIEC